MAAKPASDRLESKILVSMTRSLRDAVDEHCQKMGIPRATFIRQLVAKELDHGDGDS